jgi:hypothetical protein
MPAPAQMPLMLHILEFFQPGGSLSNTVNIAVMNAHNEHVGGCVFSSHSGNFASRWS